MRIAFSGQPLLENEKTGIGYYTEGLVRNIIRKHPENSYSINAFSYKGKKAAESKLSIYSDLCKNVKVRVCGWMPLKIYKLIWNAVPVPYCKLFREKEDITHFFNYYIPPFVKGKRVTTIHDMTIKAYPETVRFASRIMAKMNLKTTCRRATRIITSSEFSKSEIMKYLTIPSGKISVLYSGVDLNVYQPCENERKKEEVKKKYGIEGTYFLYLGTLEPRKNIKRLLLAYAMLKKQEDETPKLVISGKKGWMYDEIFRTVSEERIEKDVIFTGYIEIEDAPVLMSAATAFVFPSLYEGFGMPPLEAMACGTLVITSNCASLPEVVGEAGILVDPYSVTEISDAMKAAYTNPELRKELTEKGIERARDFSWDRIADSLYKIYEEVIENGTDQGEY